MDSYVAKTAPSVDKREVISRVRETPKYNKKGADPKMQCEVCGLGMFAEVFLGRGQLES